MPISNSLLKEIIEFRRQLHHFPELSGRESTTSKAIADFLKNSYPSSIIPDIGGHGIAVVYESGTDGPTVLFRADMDALPIQELNEFGYHSVVKGVAHLCGHDGHSAILVGVASLLKHNPPASGRVVLLFQPAEETGEGAAAVIADPKFNEIKPDYAFAMHNLPGFEKGTIYVRNETFASASTGMIIELKGKSSHAAHPEQGNNPDKALAKLVLGMNELKEDKSAFEDFVLLTIIHAKLGEVAFGTTPGNAVLMATLRSFLDKDMMLLRQMVEQLVKVICQEHKIEHEIAYVEEFPATANNIQCVTAIRKAAEKLRFRVKELDEPFRWSEDFGHFSNHCNAAQFGIGSGLNHPNLHSEYYDFPDEIIGPSVMLFHGIIEELLGNYTNQKM